MKHVLSEHHIHNVTSTFKSTLLETLMAFEDVKNQTIIAFEGENLLQRRIFCIACHSAMDAKPSVVKKHINSPKHREKIGKKLKPIDEIMSEHPNEFKRNEQYPDDVDCLVCDRSLKRTGPQKLSKHLECGKHQGILRQSDAFDEKISPFVLNKPFAAQREKYKVRKMKNMVSRHEQVEIIFDCETNSYKYYCNICEKKIIGRSDHAIDHHVSSRNHQRFQKDSDGVTLDDFLYDFFKFLVKGNCFFVDTLQKIIHFN